MGNSISRGSNYRTILAADCPAGTMYHLLNSFVAPRPIAWVSSVAEDGTYNLAPHSYFTLVATEPPSLAFSSLGEKDTLRNVRAREEFVVHLVDMAMVEQMNLTSVDAPGDVSEFELAGLTPVRGDRVDAPVVADAVIAIECSLVDVVPVGNAHLVIGECLAFHVAERVWDKDGRVDPAKVDLVARMAGSTYSTTRDRFDLPRPTWASIRTDP